MPEIAHTPDPAPEPIFVHSLYRSGSTWIFDRFRHAGVPYWCYQEPYHEATIWLQTRPDDLLGFDHRASTALRHPPLDRPYFAEVHALREQVAPLFHKGISFDSFFDASSCPAFHAYTRALIHWAPQRPMLQCCRSFGRVEQIRSEHGGIHIHLWREPKEQWWSYQINDYFDTASLLILQADSLPAPLQIVADRIGLRHVRHASHDEDYGSLLRFPIDASGRYLVFYALWLYSQLSNFDSADCNIGIDALAGDPTAFQVCTDRMRELGIEGVDLSGCTIPHSQLGAADDAFFDPLEREARQFFLEGGWAAEDIDRVVERQREARALCDSRQGTTRDDGIRGRNAALRYADNLKAARLGEQAALQQQHLLSTELEALRATLGHEQAERENARAELDAERGRGTEWERRTVQAEQHQEQLAKATETHMALAQAQVQLAQQQVELTQSHSREVRLESDRLEREVHAVRDHVGALVERAAADYTSRSDALIARVEAIASSQSAAGEALSSALAEQLASLSKQYQQNLVGQRSAWQEDLDARIGGTHKDLREAIDRSSADYIARTDALMGRVEALAARQADDNARWALVLERQAKSSAQALQEIAAQLSALGLALQSRDARVDELEREAVYARQSLNTLQGFRRAILGTRMGRWLAARKGLDAALPLTQGSPAE